jgi:hypothetical protein
MSGIPMNSRHRFVFAFLLGLAVIAGAGCRRNIVRAEPPSVTLPPKVEPLPAPAPEPPPAVAESTPAPVPEPGATPPAPVNVSPESEPARPRPAPAETPRPKAEPPPQIAPQLSPRQQAEATRSTNDDIRVAERNLQQASGKQLKPSQKDLVDKIQGFLSQAQEAIRADDWVRAQNLAHKAQVLSIELNRSF